MNQILINCDTDVKSEDDLANTEVTIASRVLLLSFKSTLMISCIIMVVSSINWNLGNQIKCCF